MVDPQSLREEVKENSYEIRRFIEMGIAGLFTVLFAIMSFWVASVSAKVDATVTDQAVQQEAQANMAKMFEDHVIDNRTRLTRIEDKLDKLMEAK